MSYSISEINQMSQESFVEVFGTVYEATPEVAAEVWRDRPFTDSAALHQAMVTVVNNMSAAAQLRLILAHPDLGSKAQMAEASVQEQSNARLDQLSAVEYAQFQRLNNAYRQKFGFPFVMAIKGQNKTCILNAFEQRLNHGTAEERARSLLEIFNIAQFRLNDLVC
jgi:2-oxo-4-hydroxy-4-carboxy-5-ureidoimidazoline decarboxylase